jgi:segregation and condensation protein B
MEDLETSPQSEPAEPADSVENATPEAAVFMDEFLPPPDQASQPESLEEARLTAILEALVYVTEEPLTVPQMAAALRQPAARIRALLEQLMQEYEKPGRGITIRELAGGFKMATKPEHHEAVRAFVKSLTPPLKLSLPALETLAMIAYKQPITLPEIKEIRGVQGAGVIKTLLDRKLITEAGRKNVVGKPILYKTTKEFLVQFGLKDLSELPSPKEFEELGRMAVADGETAGPEVESSTANTIPEPPAPGVEPEPDPLAEADPAGEAMEETRREES